MDIWDKDNHHHRHRHRRENPSFSSSLLDAIYRSIDETNTDPIQASEQHVTMRKNHQKQQQQQHVTSFRDQTAMRKNMNHHHHHDQKPVSLKDEFVGTFETDMLKFRRACMIEKWMEKKVTEKVTVRRTSMADFDRKSRNVRDRGDDREFKKLVNLNLNSNSSSSSSESSCGSGFSSSESESISKSNSNSKSSSYTLQRPKPINIEIQKPKHENSSFVKTKSKALKIYGDLKKVKQPISPGGRLATFLNSLFNTGSPKKPKFTNSGDENNLRKSKSAQASTCSSTSSFSRSCLSKTLSSSEKISNNGGITKRSVSFCPVSVILDEDSRPCGHKSLQDELGLMTPPPPPPTMTMRNILRKDYTRTEEVATADYDDDDDDDDDGMSCSSSDLFELDNLSSIGIQRYREELPVYETTHFTTNQAIANGFIL